jgi:hypothetical protein
MRDHLAAPQIQCHCFNDFAWFRVLAGDVLEPVWLPCQPGTRRARISSLSLQYLACIGWQEDTHIGFTSPWSPSRSRPGLMLSLTLGDSSHLGKGLTSWAGDKKNLHAMLGTWMVVTIQVICSALSSAVGVGSTHHASVPKQVHLLPSGAWRPASHCSMPISCCFNIWPPSPGLLLAAVLGVEFPFMQLCSAS